MSEWNTADFVAADKAVVWHPFTQMHQWCAPEHEPIVLVEGKGAILRDSRGREYIDGNSSIWTNIHGHNHPVINEAIRQQLDRVAHTSFLGSTNPVAIELARQLIALFPEGAFERVFFSDDGSTGIEVALRIAAQYWRLRGEERPQFVSFSHAYHGDTAGAAALGARTMFPKSTLGWEFPTIQIDNVEALERLSGQNVAAVVIEPLIQGAAGMRLWPAGMTGGLKEWCQKHGALLITDEVLTGFGRTGTMFAAEQENVTPDICVLGKALTGGYLPLAVTLITEQIFELFSKDADRSRTLLYGHSYTGNQIGCAAALASLEIFRRDAVLEKLAGSIASLRDELSLLTSLPQVREVRQCGFMAGIEVHFDSATPDRQRGPQICLAARAHGLLTRSIGETIVLMPPYCVTDAQLKQAVHAVKQAICEVCRE